MKTRLLSVGAALALWLSNQCGLAADANDIQAEVKNLVQQIRAKLRAGKDTEADLAAEFKAFDALLAKHGSEKTDDVAQVAYMEAMLYLQLGNAEKAVAEIKQLKQNFPETKTGQEADKIIASIQKQGEAKKIQATLTVGAKFPDFTEKDLAGKPLSIANYKGKVVLLDFWATWCGPCVAELPNVLATYRKYHGKGFEIIGVSLDDNQAKLAGFIKQKDMTWQQYFDGQGWGNKLAVKYGIESIPATFLLDGNGTIIGRDLRGEDLEAAVAKAVKAN